MSETNNTNNKMGIKNKNVIFKKIEFNNLINTMIRT